MPRKRTGTTKREGDHFVAIVTLDGKRERIPIPRHIEGTLVSQERAREIAAWYSETPDKAREAINALKAKRICPSVLISQGETVRQYGQRWLEHRDTKGMTSVANDRSVLNCHVYPLIGDKPIAAVTVDDIEGVVEALDAKVEAEEIEATSATRYWHVVRKMFVDANLSKNKALRVRKDNPALFVAPPDAGDEKALAFLYPSEFLRLASCEELPAEWRRVYILAAYLYSRVGEIERLRWEDIDLTHGVITIRRGFDRYRRIEKSTKSGQERKFRIEPALLPLLRGMHAAHIARTGDPTGLVIQFPNPRNLATQFRDHLRVAGVSRPELFVSSETHKRIRFHDLRATGITWMAIRGDDPLKIQHRAGHADLKTTQRYIRLAENIAGAHFGEPFPVLPSLLLTLKRAGKGSKRVQGFESATAFSPSP